MPSLLRSIRIFCILGILAGGIVPTLAFAAIFFDGELVAGEGLRARYLLPGDCREGISELVPAFAVEKIEKIFDRLPLLHQLAFCKVSEIEVSDKVWSTAYAVGFREDGKLKGKISIRKSFLENPIDFSRWATWKERMPFGGFLKFDPLAVLDAFPRVSVTGGEGDFSPKLYGTFVHELTHVIDHLFGVNKTENCRVIPPNLHITCDHGAGTWGRISWLNGDTAIDPVAQKISDSLCYYEGCKPEKTAGNDPRKLYPAFERTDFVSVYGMVSAGEDFAEAMEAYVLKHQVGIEMAVEYATGRSLRITDRLELPALAEKRQYLRKILADEEIYRALSKP